MWSVVGHDRAIADLERGLAAGHLSHAYVITGPSQVGKARLALDLAKAVNCTGETRPCGVCRACRLIEAGRHPDVEVVSLGGLCDQSDHDHRRDNSKDIKICQVRRVERTIALRPFEARSRVIIIDPADALNAYAADALLKTLEEPPAEVELLLVTADETALPETILSRARRIALAPIPIASIAAELSRRGVATARAALLARLSDGRIGWAIAHATDDALLEERSRRLQRLESIPSMSRAERMAFAAELAARFSTAREEVYLHLGLWQSWWRDLLLVAEGCEDLVTNSDRLSVLQSLAPVLPAATLVRALTALRACREQLEQNANARLALEVLLLRLPSPVIREEAGPT